MRRNYKRIYQLCIFYLLCFLLLLCGADNVGAAGEGCASGMHQYEVSILQNASEEEEGKRAYTCTICGDYYIEVIPSTGHVWGDWIVEQEAACMEDGYRYRICTKYPDENHRQEEAIPATGHSYKEEVTAAACDHDGEIRYECLSCHDVYTEVIPAIGHKYEQWVVEKEATEQGEGYRYRICLNDSSHIQREAIAKLPHEAASEIKQQEESEPESETETKPGIKTKTEPGTKTKTEPEQQSDASLNMMDMVLCSAILGSIICFTYAVYYDYIVICWHKRKIREYLSKT